MGQNYDFKLTVGTQLGLEEDKTKILWIKPVQKWDRDRIWTCKGQKYVIYGTNSGQRQKVDKLWGPDIDMEHR